MTMSQPHWKAVLAAVLCAAAFPHRTLAAPLTTILEIDVENLVEYQEDTSDLSKFASAPNATTAVPPRNFYFRVGIGDIVAVNGQLAKGTMTRNIRQVLLRTAPDPGQAVADTVRNGVLADSFEILKSDGTPIGTIVSYGPAAGSPAPGAPMSITQGNFAIVGGTGAFLGARGQYGNAVTPQSTPIRPASITEDPANRRRNGGGRVKFVLQVIPMFQPQIVITSGGPAVFHADFTSVTAAKPAKAGEVLIVQATGLGPTRPGVDPGQPFPTDALQQVNSPVAVTVNGQAAEVVNSVGWPGLVDTYRVDFRVPDGATGMAAIQLSAAWIAGSSVNTPIQ
jgi:uncharacterized protein (TIGR03437 family)